MQSGFNPCDVCEERPCEDCALNNTSGGYQCGNHPCFLNYEGSCVLSLYADCGAWKKE